MRRSHGGPKLAMFAMAIYFAVFAAVAYVVAG